METKYKYFKLPTKKCIGCLGIFPVTEFYNASPQMLALSKKAYLYGMDIYCKKCKLKKSKSWKTITNFRIARHFWEKLNKNKEMVELSHMSKGITGMAGWPDTLSGLDHIPSLVYCHFAVIDRRLWNIYAHAFNYLYCYERMGKAKPNPTSKSELENYIKYILSKDLVNEAKLGIKQSTPANYRGIENIAYHYDTVKHLNKVFFRYKKCLACNKIKQTYRDPNNPHSSDPISNEIYCETLQERMHSYRYTLYSFHFKQSYASVMKTGWVARCKQCMGNDVKIPYLRGDHNLSSDGAEIEDELDLSDYDPDFTLLN